MKYSWLEHPVCIAESIEVGVKGAENHNVDVEQEDGVEEEDFDVEEEDVEEENR